MLDKDRTSFLHLDNPVFPESFVEKTVLSPLTGSVGTLSKIIRPYMQGFIYGNDVLIGLYSFPL